MSDCQRTLVLQIATITLKRLSGGLLVNLKVKRLLNDFRVLQYTSI